MVSIKIGQLNLLNKGDYKGRYASLGEALDGSHDIITFQELIDPQELKTVLEPLGYEHFSYQISFEKLRKNYIAIASKTPLENLEIPIPGDDAQLFGQRTKIHGRTIFVFTCHLNWGGENEVQRMEQVENLNEAARLNQELDLDSIIVASGDFNSDDDSRTMRFMRGKDFSRNGATSTFWTDAWEVSGSADNWATTLHSTSSLGAETAKGAGTKEVRHIPDRRIDYILVKGWRYGKDGCPVSFDYIKHPSGVELSDHMGIEAELAIY